MSEKYTILLERALAENNQISVADMILLCEALDLQRRPELMPVAQQLAKAPLAEPQLRGQYYIARALANSGQQQEAWEHLADTLDAAKEEVGAIAVYIDCLVSLAGMALKMGDANQSMALATEAFNLSQDSSYTRGIATTCNHFGSLKLQQGDVQGALEYLEEAEKQAKAFNSLALDYPIHSNLGIAYMLQGQFAQALEHFTYVMDACQREGHLTGAALTGINIGNLYSGQGNYPKALENVLYSLKIFEGQDDAQNASYALGLLGDIYKDFGHYDESEQYYRKALELRAQVGDVFGQATSYHHLGSVLALQDKHDEAAEHLLHAREIGEDQGYASLLAMVYLELGGLYILQERFSDALEALKAGSTLAEASGHRHLHHKYLLYSGRLEVERQQPDEALPLLLEGEALAQELGLEDDLRKCLLLISQCFEQLGEHKKALSYYKRYYEKDKKLHGEENARYIVSLEFGHQLEQKTKEAEIERLKHIELKKAYDELKTAQERLVQQEKLASLGRLVTGIAHELQNPLNFVTNFSSLSLDIVGELQEVTDEVERTEIVNDIKENLAKITAHGKRASDIVKGMLEFKRDGSSVAQPVVIGRIVDEYVPLAWNSYRSRCPGLQVQMTVAPNETELAASVVAMDVGRVIISIMYNAFDALKDASERHGHFYKPMINVSVGKAGQQVFIAISDNGGGIAAENIPLVFEPFFTTKPAGSGNIGLGLSLAHDMITAQGGAIKVDSKPNIGTTFTVWLPSAVDGGN